MAKKDSGRGIGPKLGEESGRGNLSQKQIEKGMGGKALAKQQEEQKKKLTELVDEIKEQNKNVVNQVEATVDVEKSLKGLEGFMGFKSNEETEALREQFDHLNAIMQEQVDLQERGENFDQGLLDAARDQMEILKEGIQSEEDKREALAKQEEANSLLLKMSNSFEKGLGKVKESGGFLAGIAGLATLLLDPKAFAAGLTKIIGFVGDMVSVVEDVFAGEFESAANTIKENGGTIAAILGGVLLWNLGRIMKGVRLLLKGFKIFRLFMLGTFVPAVLSTLGGAVTAVGALFLKAFNGLRKAFLVFRLFMIGTFLPSMIAAFSGMMAAMAPILAAMVPVLIPILAIAAVFGLIAFALTKIRDALGFTSVLDVIMLGFAYLQDGFAFLGNVILDLVNWIMGLANTVIGWIPGLDEVELPTFERMETNNAANKRIELDEKARVAKLEEERKQKGFEGDQTTGLEGIEDKIAVPDISLNEFEAGDPEAEAKKFKMPGMPDMSAFEMPKVDAGDAINDLSGENSLNQLLGDINPEITQLQQVHANSTNNSGNTANTFIQTYRPSRTFDLLNMGHGAFSR